MAQSLRTAWYANRHWLAAGFLASTFLFLLLTFFNWRTDRRASDEHQGLGLVATTGQPAALWRHVDSLAWLYRKQQARTAMSYFSGTTGGVDLVRARNPEAEPAQAASASTPTDRQVIRTGMLGIVVADPLQAAEQLRALATRLSGFVVSSNVSGSEERSRSAQVTLRIPAEHFDNARAHVRKMAKTVEQDQVEARDVTREYVDREASLRNYRAEEAQYLAILKRASAVKDVLEVSSKLAEVRGRIDRLEAEQRFLRHQVEMSLLTANIAAVAEAQVFGIRWRPLYEAKLSLRDALSAMSNYADSMLALLLHIPVIALWGFTLIALLKVGWIALRRILLLFFPKLPIWSRSPAQP